ncbi:MAG: hypothetical protein AAGA81_07530 [Acidobacteriota bacterium]
MSMSISVGNAGWLCVTRSATPEHVFYVRVKRDESDRYRAREFYVVALNDAIVEPDTLRAVPLSFIEAEIASPDMRRTIALREQTPGPDLETAAQSHATIFGGWAEDEMGNEIEVADARVRDVDWVEHMWLSQLSDARMTQPKHVPHDGPPPPLTEMLASDARIRTEPGARDKGDAFYEEVADVYRLLAAHTRAVAKTIAEANGVKDTTVHRWIREARKRGFLGEATPGRVSP